ncbi:MAG TPA: hypothetical protein VJS12_26525 [Steroidobacteraceae bacterium]|nr:hypothetical protein [Steroidobacteraceae bacterium]
MLVRKIPRGTFLARVGRSLVAAAAVFAASSVQADVNSDWVSRSTGPGVFYKNNFDFADTQALINSSYGELPNSSRAVLETTNKLSGRGAFKALILKSSDESTPDYRHSFDMPVGSQTKNVKKKAFYYQFAVYLPRYILDHRFKTVNNQTDTRHKFAIIMEPDQSFDSGEVVITNAHFRRFVGAYRITNGGSATDFVQEVSGTPCTGGNPNYRRQNAINAGPQSSGGQTDATSCALYKRRYGPVHYDFSTPNSYGDTLVADPDAAMNGGAWVPDAWNVVEVQVDANTQTLKLWHAVYGNQPKLVLSYSGNADIGARANNYTGVQLLPRLEELAPDSTRQDTYAIYAEIIASDQFIAFPGAPLVRPNPPTNVTTD